MGQPIDRETGASNKLTVFVDDSQMGDYGLLSVGEIIHINFRGHLIHDFVFRVAQGTKTLRRTGMFEYVFGGEVLEVRIDELQTPPGYLSQQVLLDCGLPITLAHLGTVPFSLSLGGNGPPATSPPDPGMYIGGGILLEGAISYFHPEHLVVEIEGEVVGIQVLRGGGTSVIETERVTSIDFATHGGWAPMGALLEVVLRYKSMS